MPLPWPTACEPFATGPQIPRSNPLSAADFHLFSSWPRALRLDQQHARATLSRLFRQVYLTPHPLRLSSQARKLYQTAVNVPMHDLDGMWREYEKFENDWSAATAETATAKPREQVR